MPPVSHYALGGLGKMMHHFFKDTWGSWLAQNYFEAEHSSAYIGLINLLLLIVFCFNLKNHIKNKDTKNLYLKLIVLLLILSVLTMPPYITIKGINIYLPSYLLASYVPMFRSLVRLSVFVNLIVFILSAVQLQALVDKYKVSKFVLATILILFASELVLPVKFTQVYREKEMYSDLAKINVNHDYIAIYPTARSGEGLLNMPYQQSPLINPPGYIRDQIGFNYKDFTDNLPMPEALEPFRQLGGKYIVVYKDIKPLELEKFLQSDNIVLIKDYQQAYLYEVKAL